VLRATPAVGLLRLSRSPQTAGPIPATPEHLAANLPAVHECWPAVEGGRLLVFVCCDRSYLYEYAVPLARSLERHSPGCHLHLHVINPDEGVRARTGALQQELSLTALTHTWEAFDLPGRTPNFARTYYASVRFVRLYQLVCASGHGALLLDADALVRGDLGELRDILAAGGYDCAVHTRFWNRKRRERFFAAAFFACATPLGRAFLGEVAEYIATAIETGRARWFLDQRALYRTWCAYRAPGVPLTLYQLPKRFADYEFDKASSVWTPRGAEKLANDTYLAARAPFADAHRRPARHAPVDARPRAAVLLPRLDLPFKRARGFIHLLHRLDARRGHTARLRAPWRDLAERVTAMLRQRGCEATLSCAPCGR
jgi:hypothetical protein